MPNLSRCDLRKFHECGCAAGECQQRTKAAPAITFSAKEQFFAMAMLTLFMIVISYAALSRVDHVIKIQNLDNQEASVHVDHR